jgi:hypothetical protein
MIFLKATPCIDNATTKRDWCACKITLWNWDGQIFVVGSCAKDLVNV